MANCRTFNYSSAESDYFGGTLNLPNATTEVTLQYDAAAHTLALTMAQGSATYTKTWSGVDIATAVGGDLAYLGFGTGGGGAHALPEFVDFRFEQLSTVDPTEETIWLSAVELAAGGGKIALDTPVAGSKVRVGTVSVPTGVALAPTSADARGVLSVGELSGTGVVTIDTSAADVRIESVAAGVTDLVVSGGGRIVLPAGRALKNCVLRLAEDGTRIYAEGRAKVRSVYVGDVRQEACRYAPGDAAWMTGASVSSILSTLEPMAGFSVMFR